MAVSTDNNDFLTFQREILDKSSQDVRAYWTPERKKAAIPANRAGAGVNSADELDAPPQDGANAAPQLTPSRRI